MAAGDATHCHHCGLTVATAWAGEIDGRIATFCCPGCRAVCTAIHAAGLAGFYARTPEAGRLAPPPEPAEDPTVYDLPDVQAEFVRTTGSLREAELIVEGIHCAACVWLIERRLASLPGIARVAVNLAARRMTLRWDPAQVALSTPLAALAAIGYRALPYDAETLEGRQRRQQRGQLYRLAFAGFAMMNMLWIAIALYTGAEHGEHRDLLHAAGWLLATPTLLYAGYPFLAGAWTGLRHGYLTMDLPIAIGATVTYAYSTWAAFYGGSEARVYFDTVVNFLFVILVGRYLEGMARQRAVASTQRLFELQPRVASRVDADGERVVSVRTLRAGDHVRLRPGSRVPVDGTVIDGATAVDEALLTGESEPLPRAVGDRLFAGSMNLDGAVTLQVEQTLGDTALGRIVQLVTAAQASKAPVQRLADRIVPWFVAVTLLLAGVTFVVWYGHGLEAALMASVAVLIVTCPCAFGLATPMAIAVAAGVGARDGILVKSGAVLETLAAASRYVFDKTGTLTEGHFSVVAAAWDGVDAADGLAAVAALEQLSEHGIGRALAAHADARGLGSRAVEGFRAVPGHGVAGRLAGTAWRVGSPAWVGRPGAALARLLEEHEAHGRTCVLVAREERVVGLLALGDRLREGARELVAELRAAGARVTLLSGDRRRVVQAVAAQLGPVEVIAEVLPEAKADVVRSYRQRGERVVMVGDGVNDAPALATADVGVALGSGTDVSIECADVVLSGERLALVGEARALAVRTLVTVRQNIALSIAYNLVMVPLAMAGYVTPLLAAVTMPLSSLAVIGNAARLARRPRGAAAARRLRDASGVDSATASGTATPAEATRWK